MLTHPEPALITGCEQSLGPACELSGSKYRNVTIPATVITTNRVRASVRAVSFLIVSSSSGADRPTAAHRKCSE